MLAVATTMAEHVQQVQQQWSKSLGLGSDSVTSIAISIENRTGSATVAPTGLGSAIVAHFLIKNRLLKYFVQKN